MFGSDLLFLLALQGGAVRGAGASRASKRKSIRFRAWAAAGREGGLVILSFCHGVRRSTTTSQQQRKSLMTERRRVVMPKTRNLQRASTPNGL